MDEKCILLGLSRNEICKWKNWIGINAHPKRAIKEGALDDRLVDMDHVQITIFGDANKPSWYPNIKKGRVVIEFKDLPPASYVRHLEVTENELVNLHTFIDLESKDVKEEARFPGIGRMFR